MLIFYEEEHVKSLLNGDKKNKQLTFYELSLIAIYLRNTVGKSKSQVYSDLVEFCKENNSDFNEILGSRRLKAAVNKSDLYEIRERRDISVTKAEMETILNAFSDYKHQKVLFTMIVIAKFFHNKDHYKESDGSSSSNQYYVNQSLNSIFKIAKVHGRRSDRYKILYEIEQKGLIRTTLVGTFEILFVEKDSPVEILVTDLDDIESFFPYYCISCHKQYDRAPYSKNQLCQECYEEKRREDERLRMEKARKTNST